MFLGAAKAINAQISKGNQILINRGLQIEGLVATYDTFHLSAYSNANYTSVLWLWDSPRSYNTMSQLGPAPGFPWARWVYDETDMPPLGGESAYLGQCVYLQLADEWNLNDNATRDRAVNWFNAVSNNWPNTILAANNWGGQISDGNLIDFVNRARPDMICFDTYPWQCVWDGSAPNHIGAIISGPPTMWYTHLRIYRDISRAFNIPFGNYVQTFHAVQDYNTMVYRDPSPSELRLNHLGALAFNSKMLLDFVYNNGASSLFTAPGGDSNPNSLYYEKADAAKRCRNLGKALVRLKPIDEGTSQWTTSIMFVRGRNENGTLNPLPINFYAGPGGANTNTDWVVDRNDPYLRSWNVTNAGTKNNGQLGDVIISWFKPLDESFDGPNYGNQVYLMVINGLTATNGTAADCSQRIEMNFQDVFSALDMLDPVSGELTNVPLPVVNSRRQLTLNLIGGDAVLFKIANGAPFVGFPFSTNSNPLYLYEPFDYTNTGSPVSSNTPANWAYGGTGTNDLQVTGGNLSYPGLTPPIGNSVTNGGVGLGVRRLFSGSINTGAIYFSGLFRIADLGYATWNGVASQVGALTATDSTSFRLAVLAKSNSPSGYVLGVQKGGTGVTATFDATERHINETVFLVGKYDFNSSPNTVSLWINPDPLVLGSSTTPTNGFISANTGTDGFTIDRFNIRQNTPQSVPAAMQWDELRVGSTWASVTPRRLVRFDSITRLSPTQTRLQGITDPGTVAIETSTNLSAWTQVTNFTTTNLTFQYIDAGSSPVLRYYRAKLSP